LSGDRFEGRSFPTEVDTECKKLRDQMFTQVKAVYGQDTVNRIESYLDIKYGTLTSGSFSTIFD